MQLILAQYPIFKYPQLVECNTEHRSWISHSYIQTWTFAPSLMPWVTKKVNDLRWGQSPNDQWKIDTTLALLIITKKCPSYPSTKYKPSISGDGFFAVLKSWCQIVVEVKLWKRKRKLERTRGSICLELWRVDDVILFNVEVFAW